MAKGDEDAPAGADTADLSGDRLDSGRSGLRAFQRAVAVAVVEAVLADEDASGDLVPGSAAACACATRWLDDALGRSSGDLRRGFVLLTLLIEWLPLVVVGTPSRMSRLPLDRRIAYLEALETSRVGLLSMLFVAFKVPLCIPAFEEEAELASLGYDRPGPTARRVLHPAPLHPEASAVDAPAAPVEARP